MDEDAIWYGHRPQATLYDTVSQLSAKGAQQPPFRLFGPCLPLYPHLVHGSLGHPSPQPKRKLDRFSRFRPTGLTSVTDRQTDRPR